MQIMFQPQPLYSRASTEKFPGGGRQRKKRPKNSKKTPKNSPLKPLFTIFVTRLKI